MTALTRFVLRHKALVALFWVSVAAVGVLTISGTTHRMTNDFAMPAEDIRQARGSIRSLPVVRRSRRSMWACAACSSG